jgi:flagellar biosynthesis chaperone FliJ
LNPKKAKIVLNDLHYELGLEENLVYDILDFYWQHVRKTIVSAAHPRINIENLGIFQIKYKALDKTIGKYENAINKLGTENFNKYTKYDNMRSRLDILLKLKEEMQLEKQRRYQIKSKKYGNTTGGMEEKGKDS